MITPKPGLTHYEAGRANIISNYVRELAARYVGIREIWLFGSRANNTATKKSDWDLLVMGDKSTFDALSIEYKEPYWADILVIYDGNNFKGLKEIYNNGVVKNGSMIAWEWHQIGPEEAEYKATKFIEGSNAQISVKRLRAVRLYPLQLKNDA